MYCRHLSLTNFRNYIHLELDLPPRLSLLWGENGQGKSNLLEAIYLLATTRSFRTTSEREIVGWQASASPAFARAAADVQRHHTTTRLEVLLVEVPPAGQEAAGPGTITAAEEGPAFGPLPAVAGHAPAAVRRRVRINGHTRPTADLLGHLNVVLFAPQDIDLIAGAAEGRRRYLNITLCQIDRHYLHLLRRYERVLAQRNALLREQRERPLPPDEFEFWDAELVSLGAAIWATRLRALAILNRHLAAIHARLTAASDLLHADYRPSVPIDADPRLLGERAAQDEAAAAEQLAECFRARLAELQRRERLQGMTLAGPHRDDIAFLAGGVDLRAYGSRGQQRTAALALKLAEVGLMQEATGERPVLLLDDVMSELDPRRRAYLQQVILEQEQVVLTATELAFFAPEFLAQAARFHVRAGTITPAC
jgi:DNA replication and repair protein RecF